MSDTNNNTAKLLGTAYFVMKKETPGALQYQEYDKETGKVYPTPNTPGCHIGMTYLRKDPLPQSQDADPKWPRKLRVVVYSDD